MNHRAACSFAAFSQGNLLNGVPLCMYTNTYEIQWAENTSELLNAVQLSNGKANSEL